mgnify:CR=1 FL=1
MRLSCNPCHQIRTDLTDALKAGKIVTAIRVASQGAKILAIKTAAPAVTKNMGR